MLVIRFALILKIAPQTKVENVFIELMYPIKQNQ